MARYMGQSLLQEGGAGHTCMPCWAGYLLLDYKKGARPQPYSCPQVASSEACLTALDPCSPCFGGGVGKIGETKGSQMGNGYVVMRYVVCVGLKTRYLVSSPIHTIYILTTYPLP